MYCPNCGNKIEENQKFCSYCGINIQQSLEDDETSEEKLDNFVDDTRKHSFMQKHVPFAVGLIALSLIVYFSYNHFTNNTADNYQAENAEKKVQDISEYGANQEVKEQEKQKPLAPRNCVYETSDGVCFTTKVFEAEPIKIDHGNYYSYQSWLGSKDACESQGYRLPNDYELRSLFSDIYGINISSGIDIVTKKDSSVPPAKNYEILKKISPLKENRNFLFWENEEFDKTRAYGRSMEYAWGYYETSQWYSAKTTRSSSPVSTICVYNPSGKPYKSLLEISKENELKLKQQKLEKMRLEQEQINKEVADELF